MELTQNLLDQIWRLRFLQRNEEAREIFNSIRPSFPQDSTLDIQYRLLTVSFLRLDGKIEEAEKVLTLFEQTCAGLPAQFEIQCAIHLMKDGKSVEAIKRLLRGISKSTSLFEKFICELNILICRDYLGIAEEEQFKKIESLLLEMGDEELKAFISLTLSHIHHRICFRTGDLALLKSPLDLQGQYFQLWIRSLPYLSDSLRATTIELNNFLLVDDFFLKNYRCFTLTQNAQIKDVEQQPTASDLVDRLYLWVWKWISDPHEKTQSMAEEVTTEALTYFLESDRLNELSNEDLALLRNSLDWISLFGEKKICANIRQLRKSVQMTSNDLEMPLFSFERLIISYFEKGRDKKIKKEIMRSSLFKSSHFQWIRILQGIEKNFFATLRASKNVDVFVEKKILKVGSKRISSVSLTHGIQWLAENPETDFHQLFEASYGFPFNGTEEELARVHNLLNRIKRLSPRLEIETKNQVIYFRDPKNNVRIHAKGLKLKIPLNVASKLNPSKEEILKRSLHPRALLKEATNKPTLKRSEIQSLLKLSKASTIRWIERWTQIGFIERVDQGKSATYRLLDK